MAEKKENPLRKMIRKMPSRFSVGNMGLSFFDEIDLIILKLIKNEPMIKAQLILKLGLSETNTGKHIKKLHFFGLIDKTPQTYPEVLLSLSEKGNKFYEDYIPLFKDYVNYIRKIAFEEGFEINTMSKIEEILS